MAWLLRSSLLSLSVSLCFFLHCSVCGRDIGTADTMVRDGAIPFSHGRSQFSLIPLQATRSIVLDAGPSPALRWPEGALQRAHPQHSQSSMDTNTIIVSPYDITVRLGTMLIAITVFLNGPSSSIRPYEASPSPPAAILFSDTFPLLPALPPLAHPKPARPYTCGSSLQERL